MNLRNIMNESQEGRMILIRIDSGSSTAEDWTKMLLIIFPHYYGNGLFYISSELQLSLANNIIVDFPTLGEAADWYHRIQRVLNAKRRTCLKGVL